MAQIMFWMNIRSCINQMVEFICQERVKLQITLEGQIHIKPVKGQ